MNRERFIFLDFDGVLNTMEYQTALQWKGQGWEDDFGILFDPSTVENLKYIIDNTAANVASTTNYTALATTRILLPQALEDDDDPTDLTVDPID